MSLTKIALHVPVHLLLLLAFHGLHPLPEELTLSNVISQVVEDTGVQAWRRWR